jgi:hypothetical protein
MRVTGSDDMEAGAVSVVSIHGFFPANNHGKQKRNRVAKIPNASQAIVPDRKITAYLLDDNHRTGGPKAAFFKAFGFSASVPDALAAALQAHLAAHDIVATITTPRGVKYEISGPFPAPDGRVPTVKSVWIILNGETMPRFVTAVPD